MIPADLACPHFHTVSNISFFQRFREGRGEGRISWISPYVVNLISSYKGKKLRIGILHTEAFDGHHSRHAGSDFSYFTLSMITFNIWRVEMIRRGGMCIHWWLIGLFAYHFYCSSYSAWHSWLVQGRHVIQVGQSKHSSGNLGFESKIIKLFSPGGGWSCKHKGWGMSTVMLLLCGKVHRQGKWQKICRENRMGIGEKVFACVWDYSSSWNRDSFSP